MSKRLEDQKVMRSLFRFFSNNFRKIEMRVHAARCIALGNKVFYTDAFASKI